MFYTFQESNIWEAGDPVDWSRSRAIKRIKAKNESRARKRLPKSSLGRKWILVKTEESQEE